MQRPDVMRSISSYERPDASIRELAQESVALARQNEEVLFARFGTVLVPVRHDNEPKHVEKAIWTQVLKKAEVQNGFERRSGSDRRFFMRIDADERRSV